MGNISSKANEGEVLHLRDQNRFSIASVTVSNSSRTLLHITPNGFPATRYNVKRELGDESVIEYVQDPETVSTGGPPTFLLRLSNEDELTFTFTFVIRQTVTSTFVSATQNGGTTVASVPVDATISNLTYIFASGTRELEQLINVEFHADPNLHKNPNVQLVGDFGTGGTPSVQSQWTWKWKPPKATEDRGGGWRNSCSFVEYDQRAHRLHSLATFSFWVQSTPKAPRTPKFLSSHLEVNSPQRLRLPSSQSLESRVSESDGGDPRDLKEPQSPMFEPIPESSLATAPALTTTTTSRSEVPPSRPGEENALLEPNDLLFQAAKRDFEQRTGNIRARWKKVLKKADTALDAQVASNTAMAELMEVLRETFTSNSNGVQPAINHFFDKTAKDLLNYERSTTANMKAHILDPIMKLYNTDIKQAEAKRKDFDEKEKEYNAWVRWYLGKTETSLKEKKRAETDSKYQTKRKNFELKRFDYSSFIEDLQGGRKDQEVFFHLFQYAEAQTKQHLNTAQKIEEMKPQRDVLRLEVKQVNDEFELQRRQREEKRRALETSSKATIESAIPPAPNTPSAPSQTSASRSTNDEPTQHPQPLNSKAISSPSSAPAQPLFTMPSGNSSTHEKEGVLYALSRPGSHADPKGLNKQAWHKFWIVLNQGKLLEYTNWKVSPELQMTIDLRVAAVREARSAERRFCLEVQTPQFTRVYQDTSEEGVKFWISAINNAIQNALESQASVESKLQNDSQREQPDLNIAHALSKKTGRPAKHYSLSNRLSHQTVSNNASGAPSRHNTTGGTPTRPIASNDVPVSPLLQQLREADQENNFCADCGSADKVDWVSINLGIIICYKCGGVHRSLSRDVSKVNSLTLDTNPFTPDVIELLLKVGNRVSNSIWEARMDRSQKIGPFCSDDQRRVFITAKYKRKAYVRKLSESMPHFHTAVEPLVTSVKRNDLNGVLYALAVPKATDTDENAEVTAAIRFRKEAVDPSRKTSVVYLALAAADPASPSDTASPLHSPSSPAAARLSNSVRKLFTVAELLLLNGFEIPVENAPFPLSSSARLYLEQKKGQRGESVPQPDLGSQGFKPLSQMRPENTEKSDKLDKLQKRISTSGKLTKHPDSSEGKRF